MTSVPLIHISNGKLLLFYYLLTPFLCKLIRGECQSLSPCSAVCPITRGTRFSWTLRTSYQPLLINPGEASQNRTLQLCSSWQGNHSHRITNLTQTVLARDIVVIIVSYHSLFILFSVSFQILSHVRKGKRTT